jgi:MYXO-CTERM domain-containing protein
MIALTILVGVQMMRTAYRPRLLTGWRLIRLGKPRVVALIVFTAVIGMFMAAPGPPPPGPLLFGAIGIALVATSRRRSIALSSKDWTR